MFLLKHIYGHWWWFIQKYLLPIVYQTSDSNKHKIQPLNNELELFIESRASLSLEVYLSRKQWMFHSQKEDAKNSRLFQDIYAWF